MADLAALLHRPGPGNHATTLTVDGEPSVRVCVTPVREGALATAQNVVGPLDRDLM